MDFAVVYAGVLIVTAGGIAILAFWVRDRQHAKGAGVFVGFLAILVLWTIISAVRVFAGDSPVQHALSLAYQIVAWTVPAAWIGFVLRYTGKEFLLERRRILAGGGVYLAAVVLTASNPVHHLVFADSVLVMDPFPYVDTVKGVLFWPFLALSYITILIGLSWLLVLSIRSHHVSRAQPVLLGVGATLPLVVDGFTNAGVLPGPSFGYTPASLSLFGASAGIALFRYRLFSVEPLAHDSALEAIEEAIIVLDSDRRIVDYNRAASTVYPDIKTAIGNHVSDRYPELIEADDEAFATELTVEADRTRKRFSVKHSPVEAGGQHRGWVLVLSDVTDLLETTHDLRQQTQQLDQFASIVSHDLRNPLNVSHGSVSLARETGDLEYLEAAETALDRMAEIIDDALTLAREGQAVDEFNLIPLADTARDAWRMVSAPNVALEVDVDETVAVRGDAGRIQTLFENLFRNAVEHGFNDAVADSSPTIRVAAHDDGFFIEDNGQGIPAADREAVLEQGYSTNEDGTGFGLAIVKSIVDAHRWTITVEEGADGGARFAVGNVETYESPEPASGVDTSASS